MNAPRYPLTLIALMVALILMGFTLSVTGSRPLAWLFVAVYVAVGAAWGLLAYRSGGKS